MRLSVRLYHLSGEGSSMDRRTFVLGFLSAFGSRSHHHRCRILR
jgi:hypothetical protein